MTRAKKVVNKKISFYMSINYAKEYLIFVQTGVVFLPFHVRVKNGRHYSNFEKKNLKFEIYIIFNIYFQKTTVFL